MGAQGTLGAAAPVQRPGRLHAAQECAAIQSAKPGAHASPGCENHSTPRAMAGASPPGHPPQTPNNARCTLDHQRVHFGARRFALPFTRMCRVFILIQIRGRHAQDSTNVGALFNVFPSEIPA